MWGNDECEWVDCSEIDTYGGRVIAIWDLKIFKALLTVKDERWVIVEGTMIEDGWRCSIGVVYGG